MPSRGDNLENTESDEIRAKRTEKIERINRYFGGIRSEAYGWNLRKDETTDFKHMSDEKVCQYLGLC
jgi:hypothetical protein